MLAVVESPTSIDYGVIVAVFNWSATNPDNVPAEFVALRVPVEETS